MERGVFMAMTGTSRPFHCGLLLPPFLGSPTITLAEMGGKKALLAKPTAVGHFLDEHLRVFAKQRFAMFETKLQKIRLGALPKG